jgi:hypothetical protein
MTICIVVHLEAPTHRALIGAVCSVRRHPSPALKKLALAVSAQDSSARSTVMVKSPDSQFASKATVYASESEAAWSAR